MNARATRWPHASAANLAMRWVKRLSRQLAPAALACVFATVPLDVTAQEETSAAACPAEVQATLAAALEHALVERDLPDYGLVTEQDPIYVLDYLWDNDCLVDESVLPSAITMSALISREALTGRAREIGDFAYVRAGGVTVDGRDATVWLGAAIELAPTDELVGVTCCCGGQMRLRKTDSGSWSFSGWTTILCA